MPDIPEVVATLKRHSVNDYVLTPATNDYPIYVKKNSSEETMLLGGSIWLNVGAGVTLGEEGQGLRFYLPGVLNNYLKDLRGFQDLAIGRAEAQLDLFNFAAISRNHAIFTCLPDRSLLVEDLGSTNGTFYRNSFQVWRRVVRFARVKVGQEIMLGSRQKALELTIS
jgi:hypothetical protein